MKKQVQGLKIIEQLINDIHESPEREDAIVKTGIAVGYANAMKQDGLLSEKELEEMIEMIGQVGKKELDRIGKQTCRHNFVFPSFRELFGRVRV